MSVLISQLSLYTKQKVSVPFGKWPRRTQRLFLPPSFFFFFWGKVFYFDATESAQSGFEAADLSVLSEGCHVRLFFIYQPC